MVKADGLAAGKGVIVAMTLEEAEAAIKDMLAGNAFGEAGSRVVIEEFLDGEEASFIVMVDGKNVFATQMSILGVTRQVPFFTWNRKQLHLSPCLSHLFFTTIVGNFSRFDVQFH